MFRLSALVFTYSHRVKADCAGGTNSTVIFSCDDGKVADRVIIASHFLFYR